MKKDSNDPWIGLTKKARAKLGSRDYADRSFAERLAATGVAAGELVKSDLQSDQRIWIPGMEIFSRKAHRQPHRGLFAELARDGEGVLGKIGLWPKQWAAARMFAQSAKGFHIHPPSIPEKISPADWHRRLFIDEPANYSLRRYSEEQWDVMFFVQGRVEMLLRDVREGLPSRTMRFYIDGDDHPSESNVGVVVPPGVAHAIRVEGSGDALMVYGTTTTFHPEFEGRIASEVEGAPLPKNWEDFLGDE